MDNYAKLIKQMHRPAVSVKKKKEIEDIRKSLDNTGKPLRKVKSKAGIYTDVDLEKPWRNRKNTKSQIKIDWKKFHNPMLPKEKPKKTPHVRDYLNEIRVKRSEVEMNDSIVTADKRSPYYDWKALIENDVDMNKLKAMESKALMKEQHAKIKDDVQEEQEALNMLTSTLLAKLSILDSV